MIFHPVKLASSKQSFGMILAIGAFIWNSVDLLLIPWSKEGQSSYPYRYSSLVFLKYTILLILYILFITFSYILKRLYPRNTSHHVVLDPVELEIFDTVGVLADESSDDNTDTLFFGESSSKPNLARKINEEPRRSLSVALHEGRVFFWNGLMILLMEICIFNILEHIPAATFAIIRNLVIPCTALVRGVWLKEKPSGIQWLALIGITSVASSFASQEASFYSMDNRNHLSAEWIVLGAALMIVFIALESINIVYMERQFKETQITHQMRFTEQQFWVTFYCVALTFLFWCYDMLFIANKTQTHDGLFHGYSAKTVFLLFWRVFHAIIIFWMVRYLTSVVAMLVHTIASIGTTLLDWCIMETILTSGQWFDALAVASLVLIYKIAPYDTTKEHRPFEILQVDDDD
eukprot:335814_1